MLVVDDSPLIRRVVGDAIAGTSDLVVAGEAEDGLQAIRCVHQLQPDLVTLDIDMPAMGGLDALGYIMSECPRPVVVLSGHEPAQGGDLTIRALELGAVDFVRKPSWADALDVDTLRRRLLQALREAGNGRVAPLVPRVPPRRGWRRTSDPATGGVPHPSAPATSVVAIAASTGGPKALAELLPVIPPMRDAAIVVVQHMPAGFTASLARRLHELGPRPVSEACDGMPLLGGHVYVAPGGWHLVAQFIDGTPHLRVIDTPPVHGARPAADVTFASLAAAFGARCTAVVMTGMGKDGAGGAVRVRACGGRVLVQHPDTCVVSGMGQAVLAMGAAHAVLTIPELPAALRQHAAGDAR